MRVACAWVPALGVALSFRLETALCPRSPTSATRERPVRRCHWPIGAATGRTGPPFYAESELSAGAPS
jgi:hypothetical protein